MKKNPMYVSLAQENGFGSAQLWTMPWLVKCAALLCTCRKECNKYDLTASQCFSLAHHNDWSKWFAICSVPAYSLSLFQSYGWGCKVVHN
jgi:hypothetical protein